MSPSRTVSRMSSRLLREASRSHIAASLPKRETSLGRMSSQPFTQPPLRPLAPAPQYSRSTSTTSVPGASRLIDRAVQRPVNPPPTMHTSARSVVVSGTMSPVCQRGSPPCQ